METKTFDGTGDVKAFIEKVSIHSALKGYDGEKAAQNLASKLEGRAFDVYMRLSAADKKKAEKIQSELMKEFECGNLDRETAILELGKRVRSPNESAQTFAYKIIELVKLAYPAFDVNTQKTIAKDYFLRGVHPKMQIALKSLPCFIEADIDKLAKETMRLQLAGIDSFAVEKGQKCMSVDNESIVDEIAEKVIEKLQGTLNLSQGGDVEDKQDSATANFVGNSWRGNQRRGRRGAFSNRYTQPRSRNPRNNSTAQRGRNCRACGSPEHFFRDCPHRFCQACGNKGHDAWNSSCSKYQ